jgi:hypothetical protein
MKSVLRPLIAGIASVLPVLALAVYGLYDYYHGEPSFLPGGAPDNDPIRASGAVFILSPIFAVTFAVYFAAVRVLLRRFWTESLMTYLTVSAVISTVLATGMARDSLQSSLGGAVTAFAISFGLFFSCFALGTFAVRARP